MVQADVARIKLELIPKIQEILVHWLLVHFLGTTPTTPPTVEDFSSRLSSLHIGNSFSSFFDFVLVSCVLLNWVNCPLFGKLQVHLQKYVVTMCSFLTMYDCQRRAD